MGPRGLQWEPIKRGSKWLQERSETPWNSWDSLKHPREHLEPPETPLRKKITFEFFACTYLNFHFFVTLLVQKTLLYSDYIQGLFGKSLQTEEIFQDYITNSLSNSSIDSKNIFTLYASLFKNFLQEFLWFCTIQIFH